MAEVEDTFDEFLVNARFKDAKIHDLAIASVADRAQRMQTRPGSNFPSTCGPGFQQKK